MKKQRILLWAVCLLALLMLALSVVPKGIPAVNPATGDNSNIWLWVALLVGSLVVILLLIIFLRPKKHKGKYTRKR